MRKYTKSILFNLALLLVLINSVMGQKLKNYMRPGFTDKETLPDTDMKKNDSYLEPKNYIWRLIGIFF